MTVNLRNSFSNNLVDIHAEVDNLTSLPSDAYNESTITKVVAIKNRLLKEVRSLSQAGSLVPTDECEVGVIDRKLAFIFSKARLSTVAMPSVHLNFDRGETSGHKFIEVLQLLQMGEDHRFSALEIIRTKFSENDKKLLFKNMVGVQGRFDQVDMHWEEFSAATLVDIASSVHMLLSPSVILDTVHQYLGNGAKAHNAFQFFQLLTDELKISLISNHKNDFGLSEVSINDNMFLHFHHILTRSENGFSRCQSIDDDVVFGLLQGFDNPNFLLNALSDSLKNGKIEHVQLLLSFVQSIPDYYSESLLCDAVSSGNVEILTALLQCPLLSKSFEYRKVLKDAVTQNRIDLVHALLDSGIKISDLHWSQAARASSANLEIAELLFDKAKERSLALQEIVLSQVFEQAMTSDHQNAINFCMQHMRLLTSPGRVHSLLLTAIICNHLQVVRYFFSEGRRVNLDDLNDIVSLVIHNRIHLDILEFIFSQGATLNDRDIDRAIQSALISRECDHLLFYVQRFSESRGILIQALDSIVMCACSQGRLDLLEAALRAGPINREAREIALTQARQDIRLQAQDLLSHARIIEILDPISSLRSIEAFDARSIANFEGVREEGFYVRLSDLERDPLHYLNQLCELDRLPSRVVLLDSPRTIDLGGVSKECYYTLVQALLKKECLSISDEGFPIALAGKNDIEIFELLRKLGRFYSLIDASNQTRRDKLLVGHVFCSSFLETVKLVVKQDDDSEALMPVAEIVKNDNETNLVSLKLLQSKNDDTSFKGLSEDLQAITWCESEKVIEVANQTLMFYVKAARAFADGCMPPLKDRILSFLPTRLLAVIQGEELSSEGIISVLRCEPNSPTSNMDQKFEWIKEKIRTSDLEWKRNFVLAISGSKVLQPGRTFVIRDRASEANGVFEFHTCFNSLDVPSCSRLTKEEFLMGLDAVIGEGYNYS